VTRSGTNVFHGGAYEFFRNNIFNANNYFNKNTTLVARPVLRYNDFGFTFGGPVLIPHLYNGKNKTYFFYSQEFRRVVNYASVNAYVPTLAERQGDFSTSYLVNSAGAYTGATGPVAVCQTASNGVCTAYAAGSAIGSAFQSNTAKAYLKDIYSVDGSKVPLPPSALDIAAGQDPHLLVNNIRNVFNDAQEFVRIDHALSPRVNVFYRYLHDSLPDTQGTGYFAGSPLPGVATSSDSAPGTQHMGHVTIAARPTLLMDMGYAYSSGAIHSNPIGSVASGNSPDVLALTVPQLPFPNTLGVIPALSFPGNGPSLNSLGIYNEQNVNNTGFGNFTKIKAQHTLKFGLTYNHYQ
jgi:hypothetical protein